MAMSNNNFVEEAETVEERTTVIEKEEGTMTEKTTMNNAEEETTMTEKLICAHCGCVIDDDDYYTVTIDGNEVIYCTDCATECEDCGEVVLYDDAIEYEGYYYCKDCTVFCRSCGDRIPTSEAIEYGGHYYCPECCTRCSCCDELVPDDYVYYTADTENPFCSYCWDNHTCVCERCGDHYEDEDNIFYCEEDDAYYCEDCMEYVENQHGPINSYHTMKDNEDPIFYGDDPRDKVMHIGFELEVDRASRVELTAGRGEMANHIVEIFRDDFFRFENDGSLSCYGWENISEPATLKYLLDHKDEFKVMFNYLVSHGMRSHDAGSCGLHIHLDRKFFGREEEAAIAKMLYLFEKFQHNMLRFSRRTWNQIDNWSKFRTNGLGTRGTTWIKDAIKESKSRWHGDRYYAVNLTNRDTVEIRLWRGTLSLSTFFATLKFTVRLAELCKTVHVIPLAKMTWEEILGDDPEILAYWETVKDREV